MVIVGLFGSNALGGLSGSLSLELDRWHWIFVVNIIRDIMLNSRQRHIKKNEYHQTSDIHISRSMMITFSIKYHFFNDSYVTSYSKGYHSLWVWPILLIAIFLL